MDESLNMKNNLIQNFYIIGVNHEEILSYIESSQALDLSKKFIPKMISKFPQDFNNYNTISDQNVIEHCFPNNISIKKGEKYEKYSYHFELELENNIFKYLEKNKCLYNKIHFTCLKFYEPIKAYIDLKNYIDQEKKVDSKNINNQKIIEKYEFYYVPKIICFASLMPFPVEHYKILRNIYTYYECQNIKSNNEISYPIEKLIEQIIMSLPIPVTNDYDISLTFDIKSFNKNIFPHQKIVFSSYELRDYYLDKSYDLDIREIFIFNKEETIVNILKNIILENSILIFSEYKQYLSKIIESFLNIISPFKYVYPCVTILPQAYYGLINSQDKFIFGINQKFSENFFSDNEISINKNILIVNLTKNNKSVIKINTEELLFKEEELNFLSLSCNPDKHDENESSDNLYQNDIFNIDLPIKYKKKLIMKLKNYLDNVRSNWRKKIYETRYIFKCTILNIFHKFFINILSGYTKYLLKCPYHNYFGYSIRHKYKGKNEYLAYIKEIFDYDEFLLNIPKENHLFYKTFFQTKLFFNYIKGIIYPNSEIDSLKHKYFDFLTFLKKEKGKRKSEEFSEQYQKYKMPFGKTKCPNIIEIVITNKLYFNDFEKSILDKLDNRKKALEKYGQLISKNNENINYSIKYFIFPKLLFDNDFFNINYKIQFYRHFLDLPSDKTIKQLNTFISESEKEFLSKCCFTIYKNIFNDISSSNFELYSYDYIEFNWLLLSSCSLWYCNSNKEMESRINKIFNILEKLEYIEEQVLYFILYSIYKNGSISHFIRIFEIVFRFMGYYSYSDLLLLYDKLKEGKINLGNNDIDIMEKRSLIDIKRFINNELDDKIKEEITFNNEQNCEKCGEIIKLNEQDFSELINKKIDKTKNVPMFKCKSCNKINFGITINYRLSLINIRKKKEKLVSKDKFSLIMPHLLYCKIKDYLINIKGNKLDINNIFSNKNIDILNFIFYFSLKSLPFDFLLPYENSNEPKEYFFNYDYINKKKIKKFENLSITNEKFILNNRKNK